MRRLRDKIVELAHDRNGPTGGRFTASDLHTRLSRFHDGHAPMARATLYAWFAPDGVPTQALLECVPALARIFNVDEHVLWRAAGILPPEVEASSALAAGAHVMREAHREVAKTLAESGLSTAGEALVVDRILHARLDYRMTVWPVVRGERRPLHLHSWIVLEPMEDADTWRRSKTIQLEALPPLERRAYLREAVIREGLWRALGLQWRNHVPARFRHLGPSPLFIEVPVEERNRPAPAERPHEMLGVERILVLGAPWAHAELMAALMADALRFGSVDLRYLGYPSDGVAPEKEEFCRERLAVAPPWSVWAIAQRSDVMARLRTDLVRAASSHLVVAVTYDAQITEWVARHFGTRLEYVHKAVQQIADLADEVADHADIIRVHIADSDVVAGAEVDPHRMTDRARYLTAGVLNLLYERRMGPPVALWGDRFDDCRTGEEARARLPAGESWVRWVPRHVG